MGFKPKPTVQVDKLSNTDWAYLAGLFDGEGWMYATLRPTGATRLDIGIANTDTALMAHLRKYGGRVRAKRGTGSLGGKVQYEWRLTRVVDMHIVLTSIEPYLVTKADRARELIAIIERILSKYKSPV